ncbi:hypothetical protein CMUS01_16328, partial [Colletotrichum musicola]
ETPFERDFRISIRLNHLHVLFLLRRLVLNRVSEPDGPIIEVAQEMLSLVIEAVLVRDELANSGTTLSWKVAHYGLPAAGMILLGMMGHRVIPALRSCRAKVLRDLTVLAAEVGSGTIVKPENPNYALLTKATQTIHRFLDFIHSDDQSIRTATEADAQGHTMDEFSWAATLEPELWGSEFTFWQGLADHPSVFNQDLATPH